MKEQLEIYFKGKGYNCINTTLSEFTIYYHKQGDYLEVILLIDEESKAYVTPDQYNYMKGRTLHMFCEKGFANAHMLSLVITKDNQKAIKVYGDDKFCWILNSESNQLMIYESQVSDFYGMKNELEKFVENISLGIRYEAVNHKNNVKRKEYNKKQFLQLKVTCGIIVLNILVFILNQLMDGGLNSQGSLSVVGVVDNQEWYRLFTCIFLHSNMDHIFSNLLSLYAIGGMIERKIGHMKYLFLYLISGIGGGVLSLAIRLMNYSIVGSVGASGAIFGLVGGLLILVIKGKGRIENITTGRIAFLLFYLLYSGFRGTNIDNAGHVGGLITGILVTIIFTICSKKEK